MKKKTWQLSRKAKKLYVRASLSLLELETGSEKTRQTTRIL